MHLDLLVPEGDEHSHVLRGDVQCSLHYGLVVVLFVDAQEAVRLRRVLIPHRSTRKRFAARGVGGGSTPRMREGAG